MNGLEDILKIVVEILSVISTLVAVISNIYKNENITFRKQSDELRKIAIKLECAENNREIKRAIAKLKTVINYNGIIRKSEANQNQIYIWNQINKINYHDCKKNVIKNER